MSSSSVRVKRRRTGESDTEGTITEPERTNKAEIIRPVSESVDGSGNPEPISVSEKRYRDWRKKGSPRQSLCFVCNEGGDLRDCYTCPRSYHKHCLDQPVEQFIHNDNFFCRICQKRQWHQHLPPLSPPPSPPPEKQRVALPSHRPNVQANNEPRLPSTSPAPASNSPALAPTPTHTPASAPTPASANQHSQATAPTSFTWLSQNQFTTPLTRSGTTSSPRASTPLSGVINISGAGRGMVAGPRGPRSRFSTLPAEVDDAVSLLLRELEYLGDARQKITQLEDVIVRLQQDVKINENALILAQRNAASSNSRNSEGLRAENEKLKKEAEDMRRLLADEKSRSRFHQEDAEYWKSQAQSKQTELEELRGKLKNLLGG
ncbi:uncharacterized protein TrAFT101_011766 [Trichoderma asperellum]|uniref:uncharacterized protein n=1 Tax=Trichoderma asperellum TaxID=101201 RepID=UPI00332342B6|nr:hypothetical protein TrAFT101_011766 [Trichoderma asperellum]